MKHHYLPEFYLKRWVKANSKVRSFSLKNGNVAPGEHTPKYTGYEEDLYAKKEIFTGDKNWFEDKLFVPIDNKAATVLDKILLDDVKNLSYLQRQEFAHFLISLLWRNPSIIKIAEQYGYRLFNDVLPLLSEDIRGKILSETGYLQKNIAMETIASRLASSEDTLINQYELENFDRDLEALVNMFWWTEKFDATGHSLLTSDHPFMLSKIYEPNCVITSRKFVDMINDPSRLISIPLSPSVCFFAHSKGKIDFKKIGFGCESKIIKYRNMITVKGAKKFVYANDDTQTDFIKKHFIR